MALSAVLLLAACGGPPVPPAPPADESLLWSSGFEAGTTDEWRYVSEVEPGRIEVVEDPPAREGRYSVRLTGDSDDPGPDDSVRSQLDGPALFDEGDEAFIGWSTYFPADIPAIPDDGWFLFFQFHGAPFNGSPPMSFDLAESDDGGQQIGFARNEQYDFDVPWSMPLVTERWVDFTMRVSFSDDESVGFVELWVDGQPQTFSNGSNRLPMSTLIEGQESLFPIATVYYDRDAIDEPVTVYHDAVRVGDSYESAAPRL